MTRPSPLPTMRFGSICSGIEAASAAWSPLGWQAAWFAEIAPFPSAVLAHHYPEIPNHGDFTQLDPRQLAGLDVLIAGTPCQDFSVAGLRAGLGGERGNLTLELFRLIARCPAAERPRWIVWENVFGVLSIDNGRAFGAVLGALEELGYGFAYRVLDAQYFGVPQRRRRVFVVGCLGGWGRAAAVLFESHCLQGHPPPSREKRQDVAPTISARTKGGGGLGTDFDCDGGLIAKCLNAKGGSGRIDAESETFVAHSLRGEGFDASEDGTGRGTPLVPVNFIREVGTHHCIDCDIDFAAMGSTDPTSPRVQLDGFILLNSPCPQCGEYPGTVSYPEGSFGATAEGYGIPDTAQTITADMYRSGGATAGNNPGVRNVFVTPILEAGARTGKSTTDIRAGSGIGDPCHPLAAGAHAPAVSLAIRGRDGVPQIEMGDEVANAILTPNGGRGGIGVGAVFIQGEKHGDAYEVDSSSVLSTLRDEVGAEAVAEWGSRILDSLQSEEILRAWLHGASLRSASNTFKCWVGGSASSCAKNVSSGVLREVWENGPNGRTSQGRGLAKQLSYELGEALPQLPHQDTFNQGLLLRLRKAAEGVRTLRKTLSTIQEVRGPIAVENQPAHTGFAVRRLTVKECCRLQGFPDDYLDILYRGKPAADGPRYKALGNSMAVPVIRWLGERIAAVDALPDEAVAAAVADLQSTLSGA